MYKNLRGEKDVCLESHSSLFISFSKTCTFKDVDHLNPLEKNDHDARLKDALLYLPQSVLTFPDVVDETRVCQGMMGALY